MEFIPTLCSGQALSLLKDSLAMKGKVDSHEARPILLVIGAKRSNLLFGTSLSITDKKV